MLRKLADQPFNSSLLSNRRNELLYWMGSLIIFPAYAITTQYFVDALQSKWGQWAYIAYILLGFAILPQITASFTKKYWHMTFASQGWVFTASFFILIEFQFYNLELTLQRFWFWFIVVVGTVILRRLFARKRHQPDIKTSAIIFLLILGGWLAFSQHETLSEIAESKYGFLAAMDVAVLLSCVYVTLRITHYNKREFSSLYNPGKKWQQRTYIHFIKNIVIITAGMSLGIILLLFPTSLLPIFLPILCYSFMLLGADPILFISGQLAHWRSLTRTLRHDYIHHLITPSLNPRHPINRVDVWLRQFWRQHDSTIIILGLLTSGFFIIPLFLSMKGFETDIGKLISVGLVSGIVFPLIYLIGFIFYFRPKHIITPFIPSDETDSELKLLAEVVTQSFVKNLRSITLLLNAQQVENLNIRNDPSLAVFVTSRQDQETIDQLQSLGTIEIANLNLPFGKMLSSLLTQLASTRIWGSLQRRDDHTVAISLEFTRRGGKTIAVDIAWIPENTVRDIDENVINDMTKTLAVKLILNLGHISHIATRWESLRKFVDGLDAAYQRHWRHAIACYRSVIEIEETVRGVYGIGYYHLGAALIFQGELEEGLRYLEKAEAYGPPIPENFYMIALVLFNQYRDILHKERSIFADIEEHCKTALALQNHFPEAHHLLGAAYYQRGKLRERSQWRRPALSSDDLKKIDPWAAIYKDDYAKACNHLKKAIIEYDIRLKHLSDDIVATTMIFDEHERIAQDRMAAAHRLADVLRSLERYAEAEGYYDDVMSIYPANIQSMIDQAKIYCLSENWQKADEYIRNEVYNHPEVEWHKSINLYKGWSLIGGLNEELTSPSQFLNFVVLFYGDAKEAFTLFQKKKKDSEYMELLRNGVADLDYALHQFPGYNIGSPQNNWLDNLEQVTMRLTGKKLLDQSHAKNVYSESINKNGKHYVLQLYAWLAWRMDANQSDRIDTDYFPFNFIGDTSKLSPSNYPEERFSGVYRQLKQYRQRLKQLLADEDRTRLTNKFSDTIKWLQLGRELFEDWQKATTHIESLNFKPTSKDKIEFGERWMIDVYAEFSILATRVLAESGEYTLANQVATISTNLMRKWLRRWHDINLDFTFSNKVTCFQMATLHAWNAFCLLQKSRNSVLLYLGVIGTQKLVETDFKLFDREIERSLRFVPQNDLAIYVRSLIRQEKEFLREATQDLDSIIAKDASFNPHRYTHVDDDSSSAVRIAMNDSNSTAQITMIDQQNPNHKTSEPETRLSNYYQDRVSGFLQFKSLADRIALHTNLAKIYEGLNALSLSSEHLLQAIAFTPFKDLLAEQILRLAHDLNDDDRYLEALAAVEEASFRSHHLSPLENHMMRYYEPKVFACVVNTNLERYQIALINAKTILEHMSLGIFIFQHMHVVEELITIFSRPREFKRILDRLKKYWQKLYKIRNGIEKSETTNDLPDIKTVIRLIDESCKLYHDISYDQTKNQNNYLDTWLDTIYRQSAAIILQDVSEYAYLICELKNTISFNNAELGLDLDDAVEMANYATQVLDYLIRCAPQFIPWQLSKRLGQYYDTRAWALFRMENSKVIISNSEGSLAKKRKQPKDIKLALNEPQKLLLNEALARDSSSAVIYYHLARISIAQLEVIWQSLPAEKRLLADVDSQTAHEISLCLRQALLYWRQATRLAKGNGLTVRLRLVRQRIEDYRNEWNKLQTPSIMWGSAIVDKLQDYPAKQ